MSKGTSLESAKLFVVQLVTMLNSMFNLKSVVGKVRPVYFMTAKQLMDLLLDWNLGSQPASIQYVTEPPLIAEGKAKFGGAVKIGTISGLIGYDYENSVNLQRKREGLEPDFKAQSLWNGAGEVLHSTMAKRNVMKNRQKDGIKFKEPTGEVIFYLRYKHQKSLRALHFDSAMNFLPIGLIKPFFKPYYANKSQGVDKVIKPRTLKIENVRRLRFKGIEIQVIPE
jgi:hypothetical protein